MPVRSLAALVALTLSACATPERLALASSPASRLADEHPPEMRAPPPPPEVAPLRPEAVSGEALRQRLVRFVSDAQAERAAALPGDAMSSVQLARWESVQTDVERFLTQETTADDLSAVRALLQAALELDVRAYEDVPEPLFGGQAQHADLALVQVLVHLVGGVPHPVQIVYR